MLSKSLPESMRRQDLLRELLTEGKMSTQEELADELRTKKFAATQSTISRDLRRLGAVKTRDSSGRIVYRLPNDSNSAPIPNSMKGLLVNVAHNGSLIVIQTSPGSASLVARQLDQTRPAGIIGTIAGDDTIFVAPASSAAIQKTVKAILELF